MGKRQKGGGGLRRGGGGAYTGRFFETHRSPEAVMLSAVKDLRGARREILHCAQHDTSHLAGSFPKKPPRVSAPTDTAPNYLFLPPQVDVYYGR